MAPEGIVKINRDLLHIDDALLERWILSPDGMERGDAGRIGAHLERCVSCRGGADEIRKVLLSIRGLLDAEPTAEDRRFASESQHTGIVVHTPLGVERRREVNLDTYAEVIAPSGWWPMKALKGLIVRHPMKFAAASSFSILALATAFLFLRTSRDTNPVFAEVRNFRLTVYNQSAEALWSRSAFGVVDQNSRQRLSGGAKRTVRVMDVDGDGSAEVLLTGVDQVAELSDDTLYCFEASGTLRWKIGGGGTIPFGQAAYTDGGRWRVQSSFTLTLPGEGRPRLYALFESVPHWPGKLVELQPADGRVLQTYLHAGHITAEYLFDVDGDGGEEIVLGGINNFYERACLIVLDPENISGHSPIPTEFRPAGVSPAAELYYLLLPRTDLSKVVARSLYNSVDAIVDFGENGFLVSTLAAPSAPDTAYGGIIYRYGRGMRLAGAIGNDTFIEQHTRLRSIGKLTETLDDRYYSRLTDSILSWDGFQFRRPPPTSVTQ